VSNILLVEDEPLLQELALEVLSDEGHAVTVAGDGVEALEHLGRTAFDLVVTDVRMPRMDGLELLSRMRDMQPHPRVVVLTADDAPQTMLSAIRHQAIDYLVKPVSPSRLAALVREILSRAAERPIEVVSATPHWVELLVPCELQAADRIQGYLERLETDLAPDVRDSVGRVFRELLLNAIEWGGRLDPDRSVRISFLRGSRMLLYRIADPGPGFKVEQIPHAAVSNPTHDPLAHAHVREDKGLRPGGLGLLMAQSLADELLYNEARNEVVFVKYL
jgi:CheY-like chemotaxis protein/anti-sigma regulatory factor (Ser/Thr protein kinase)